MSDGPEVVPLGHADVLPSRGKLYVFKFTSSFMAFRSCVSSLVHLVDGWTTQDVIYVWKVPAPVQMAPNLFLPGGFELNKYRNGSCNVKTATGSVSRLRPLDKYIDLVNVIPLRAHKDNQGGSELAFCRHSLR